MSKIVFITPNMGGDFSEEVLGTLQLATILNNSGIDCEILQFYRFGDTHNFDVFLNNAMDMLEERSPKIVSFYTRCDSYHIDLRLADLIKRKWPNTYVIFGGPQSDITAEETVKQIPYVDFVCCGEGETTIYPFFASLLQNTPDTTIAGLVFLKDGIVHKNPRPALTSNLDDLPMIDYAFFSHQEKVSITDRYYFPIDVGRGCPFCCTYCSTNTFWGRKYRVKSPQRIVDEIKVAHQTFGKTIFGFSHDMFTLNRQSVIETCRLLKELDFPIQWKCSARLDCLDKELIDIMADAGMERIFIGIETGSPRMQKLIKKNLKLNNAIPILSYLKEKNVKTTASFIYGFPEETEEDLSQTLRLIGDLLKIKTVATPTHLCTFLSGTELSDRYISRMTRADFYSSVTGDFAIEECRDLIDSHPELFLHMLEYKTELRSRLKYFRFFIRMWQFVQPVYQYISEKYPSNQLLQMYYDFVDANQEFLEELEKLPPRQLFQPLLQNDKLPARFSDDPNYDIMTDYYRLMLAENSDKVRSGEAVSEIYCFAPSDRKHKEFLQDYTRCIAVVSWQNNKKYANIIPLETNS